MATNMHKRLRDIRLQAGFRSAAEAASAKGWTAPTYAAHENGSRGFSIDQIEVYAKAFNADPSWLAFGLDRKRDNIANIPDNVLLEVLTLVLSNQIIRDAAPEMVAELVLEICRYVHKSGSAGMAAVIDFQLAKIARTG